MFSIDFSRRSVRAGLGGSALLASLLLASCGGGGGCASAEACAGGGSGASTGAVTSASAVSVSIGTDGTLGAEAVDSLKYSKRFVVTVVDQLGRPVLGATISPRVEMLAFAKGYFERDPADLTKVTNEYRYLCQAEDANNNDILDANEDVNGDGLLTPPRSTVVIVPTKGVYTTDASGSVVFELQYPKNYATWIVPTLVATAGVTGTEGQARFDFVTGYVVGDEKQVSAPFNFSPFGTTPACTDTN
ncbi:hypothetical protein [Ramlibacter tataouinensis]|uniref:Lipoprotein n=1 Tax=Ramlibacter tataouinensis (strain ATCC BAA-407 / DSM 14655 / LMG 21543 / TTB310) TaxID=365046 RepID=F5XY89_RAMTT|nr:hypothetical protein [Ramlibacter tataouinensis]AEG91882.1 Hypothetical protein Rta_08010 [Ramlibacter tataouinensis TTB310]